MCIFHEGKPSLLYTGSIHLEKISGVVVKSVVNMVIILGVYFLLIRWKTKSVSVEEKVLYVTCPWNACRHTLSPSHDLRTISKTGTDVDNGGHSET